VKLALAGAAVTAGLSSITSAIVMTRVEALNDRWILAYSIVLSPLVLLGADIAGRVVIPPDEVQAGVVLGVIGAPAFVALVRFRNLTEL
jgi:iron complex transport system permease protein